MLRVVYTDSERLELGKQLAESHNDLAQVNSDFDRVKASFKSKITAHESHIVDLSNKVASGYRVEDVKCRWQLDYPKPLFKTLFRLDTQENIETVEMTAGDRQAEIELAPPGAAGTGIAGDGSVTVPADGQ